jgi:excisionase family DNA binding protein
MIGPHTNPHAPGPPPPRPVAPHRRRRTSPSLPEGPTGAAPATATPLSRRPPVGLIRSTNPNTGEVSEPVLFTAEQAAELLQVRPSWLRRKAAAHAVPCRFVGKHLRFSRADISAITEASARPPRQRRRAPSTG